VSEKKVELELMLSLVGDFTGERIAEILGEELTGSLIENSGEDLREEGEMLQLRMDQWKVAVNPQVQKAAEAAERSRVVPGVEIADDYEPSREEVAHHWGMSVEKVAWAELWEEDWIMSLRRCWLRVSHASGAPDHMLERPRDELETTAMKRFPAVNPSPSSVAPEPRVDVDFLGPRGQSTQRAQQGRAPSLFCPALPCFGRRSGLPCPALPYRSFPLWLSCPALPCCGFFFFFLDGFCFQFCPGRMSSKV
jgi:hypothetical protein